jgi:chitinase
VNTGGAYRVNEQVDTAAGPAGGYQIIQFESGEWVAYSIRGDGGSHPFQIRVANNSTAATFHVELDGTDLSGPINVPNTGGSSSFVDVTVPSINVRTGKGQLRLVNDSGAFAIDYFSFN